jgi:GT2 family glycosyltransferase
MPGANENRPSVGVVVLNWNGYEYTIRCIASLLVQRYPSFRIYIVDNNSENDEGQRLARLYYQDSRVTVILNPRNDGYAGGNNVGIQRALQDGCDRGIWCLNNDATAEPEALSALVSVAETDDRIGLVGSTILYPDRKTIYGLGGGTFNAWTGIDHLYGARSTLHPNQSRPKKLSYISGASLFLTRRGLALCPGFDADYFLYCEELDLALRMGRAGLKLAYAQDSIVTHAFAATTGHMSATYVYYFLRNRLLLLKKQLPWYHGPSYVLVYLAYYVLGFMLILTAKRRMALWRYIPRAIGDFLHHRWGYQSLQRAGR